MPCKLDQVALGRLAEIAKIPPEGRQLFAERMTKLLGGAWKSADWWETRRLENRPKRQDSVALAKVEKAARRLTEALDELEPDTRAMLQAWLPYGAWPQVEGLTHAADLVTAAARMASLSSELATKNEPRRLAGRPSKRPGSGALPGADLFVLIAHEAVKASGGRLTFSYANKSGTLLSFLDELKPHLPNGHVPSLDRLRALRAMWRRGFRG